MSFIDNIKSAFATSATVESERDRADLVQTVLLVAGFAIATLLAVNWLGTAILNKTADAAQCIEGSNSYNTSNSATNCASVDHSKDNSFKNDGGYKGRFN